MILLLAQAGPMGVLGLLRPDFFKYRVGFSFWLGHFRSKIGSQIRKKGGDGPHRATIAIHREFTARVYVNVSNK